MGGPGAPAGSAKPALGDLGRVHPGCEESATYTACFPGVTGEMCENYVQSLFPTLFKC